MIQLSLFFVLVASSQQCDVDTESILINSGNSTITIMKNESSYLIYYMKSGVNEAALTYSTPLEQDFYLTYDTDFKVNFRNVTRVGIGQVELSPILQTFLRPINSYSEESFQTCFDFSNERISLKITVGILLILCLVSNGSSTWTFIQTISADLLRSKFAGRFSRSRSLVPGSEENNTGSNKTTSC